MIRHVVGGLFEVDECVAGVGDVFGEGFEGEA